MSLCAGFWHGIRVSPNDCKNNNFTRSLRRAGFFLFVLAFLIAMFFRTGEGPAQLRDMRGMDVPWSDGPKAVLPTGLPHGHVSGHYQRYRWAVFSPDWTYPATRETKNQQPPTYRPPRKAPAETDPPKDPPVSESPDPHLVQSKTGRTRGFPPTPRIPHLRLRPRAGEASELTRL